MIVDFVWLSKFAYSEALRDFRVHRLATSRWAKGRRYRLQARDAKGIVWHIAQITTDGPLTNEERKQSIDLAPYHPTMEVHHEQRG